MRKFLVSGNASNYLLSNIVFAISVVYEQSSYVLQDVRSNAFFSYQKIIKNIN